MSNDEKTTEVRVDTSGADEGTEDPAAPLPSDAPEVAVRPLDGGQTTHVRVDTSGDDGDDEDKPAS